MYFHYCLIAAGTIIAISLVVFFLMKKNNQVNRENNAKLIVCTILSIMCAAAVPPTAKITAREFDLSIYVSIFISVLALAAAAIIIFLIVKPAIAKLSPKQSEEPETPVVLENPSEQVIEASAQAAPAAEHVEPLYATIPDQIDTPAVSDDADNEITVPEDFSHDYTIEPETVPVYGAYDFRQEDIIKLLNDAIEMKSRRDLYGAISNYEAALIMDPDDELRYLILLDLCSLYKKTGQHDSISKILESTQCDLLNSEKKADILRNL